MTRRDSPAAAEPRTAVRGVSVSGPGRLPLVKFGGSMADTWGMSTRRSMIRGRCGVDLLEMSNALSVLLFVTFGMVEFGQYYNVKHCFEAAVRDGSRVATLPSASQAQMVATITTTLQQANVTFNAR